MNDFLGLPGQVDSPVRSPINSTRPNQRPNGLESAEQRSPLNRQPGAVNGSQVASQTAEQTRRREGAATLPANGSESIRNRWQNQQNLPFNADAWRNPPAGGNWYGAWARQPTYWAWRPATFTSVGGFLPYGWQQPMPYNYGTSLTYQNDNVYQEGQLVASAHDYADQANAIAENAPADVPQDSEDWLPLGVFAIAEEGGKDSGMLMQLAVSKQGMIAGTYYHDTSGNTRAMTGTVDRETQRAAWKFADGKQTDVVFETGIANLTQDESKCLVHFGSDKTQTWTMVRVPAPSGVPTS